MGINTKGDERKGKELQEGKKHNKGEREEGQVL